MQRDFVQPESFDAELPGCVLQKLNIHQGDLDILIKSGVLKESSNAIVVLRLVTEGRLDYMAQVKEKDFISLLQLL